MAKGQLSRDANRRQEHVENPLALIGSIRARLDNDSLRIRQAIRRSDLADLLSPVLDDHQQIAADLRKVQEYLHQLWDEGQADKWK